MNRAEPSGGARPVARHHLAKGMHRVVSGSDEIRTVVGPGLALAVWWHPRPAGGLVHLQLDPWRSKDLVEDVRRGLQPFLEELRTLGRPRSQASARLIGGADILGTFSSQQHAAYLEACQLAYTEVLGGFGIQLSSSLLGGSSGRSVTLMLGRGRVESTRAGTGGRARRAASLVLGEGATPALARDAAHTVPMGRLEVARAPITLVAILGSCVGIALWDPMTTIGGLAHVMMPIHPGGSEPAAKYADTAVDALLPALERAGADRRRLRARLTGGANVLAAATGGLTDVASRNIAGARASLAAAGLQVEWEDVGGRVGRKVFVNLETFDIAIKRLDGTLRRP